MSWKNFMAFIVSLSDICRHSPAAITSSSSRMDTFLFSASSSMYRRRPNHHSLHLVLIEVPGVLRIFSCSFKVDFLRSSGSVVTALMANMTSPPTSTRSASQSFSLSQSMRFLSATVSSLQSLALSRKVPNIINLACWGLDPFSAVSGADS